MTDLEALKSSARKGLELSDEILPKLWCLPRQCNVVYPRDTPTLEQLVVLSAFIAESRTLLPEMCQAVLALCEKLEATDMELRISVGILSSMEEFANKHPQEILDSIKCEAKKLRAPKKEQE